MFERDCKCFPWILACLLAASASAQAADLGKISNREKQDLLYVKGLAETNDQVDGLDDDEPLTLDLSDPAQLRFLKWQQKAAKLGRFRAPSLAGVEKELATAYARQKPSQKLTLAQMEDEYGSWQPNAMITYLHREEDGLYRVGALYSVANTIRVVLMLQLFDAAWQPIGELAVVDDWLENLLTLEAVGRTDTPGVTAVFTYFYDARDDPSSGTAQVIFKHLEDVPGPTFTGMNPRRATAFAGIHPSKAENSASRCLGLEADCIRVCDLGKRENTNCDYETGDASSTSRRLAACGSVSFPINASSLAVTGGVVATQTLSRLSGGTCQTSITASQAATACPRVDGPNSMPCSSYQDDFAIGISGGEVCWNDGSSIFDTSQGCWSTNNRYQTNYYNLQFTAVLADGSEVAVTVTSVDDAPPIASCNSANSATCQIPPIHFVWGCLPTGTPVRMADGSLKPIEEVQVEERVLADAGGRTLTVVDTIWGTEEEPLVVIEDDRGNVLKATNTHPIVTARGVMLAKQVVVGDVLTTENGPSKVVAIGQETTDAKIWNLNLGGDGETVTNDNTTLFANGILVGDNQMQGTYERRYETGGGAIDEIPEQWQGDYKKWLKRQKKSAAGGGPRNR